jgi:hypothetical protein
MGDLVRSTLRLRSHRIIIGEDFTMVTPSLFPASEDFHRQVGLKWVRQGATGEPINRGRWECDCLGHCHTPTASGAHKIPA